MPSRASTCPSYATLEAEVEDGTWTVKPQTRLKPGRYRLEVVCLDVEGWSDPARANGKDRHRRAVRIRRRR